MDCNKEEALRAKAIAEKKMENKDFSGARTLALKAQKLYPDLENIAQLLFVCDVHCSAEQKLLGNTNVVDWYKVLQVDRKDNDAIIKKQYKTFALRLHPDKNKFSGAEAAFKLIGEAQRVLLDRTKRSSLDMQLNTFSFTKTAMPSHNQWSFNVNFNPVVQTNYRPVFTNINPQQKQQSTQPSQQGVNGGNSTFWTMCSYCSVKFQYYRSVLNRSLRCSQCSKPFIAYEVNVQSTNPAANSSRQASGQQNNTPHHSPFNVGVRSQGDVYAKRPKKEARHKKGSTSNVSVKSNGKRRRNQIVESSESSESIGSTDSEDDTFSRGNGFPGVSTSREEHPRRSTRQKHQVSYNENVSDDDNDLQRPSKQGKVSASSSSDDENNGEETEMNDQNGLASGLKDDKKEVKRNSNGNLKNIDVKIKEAREKESAGNSKIDEATEQSDSKSTNQSGDLIYPDPEFYDFDKDKKEGCFATGQIWAIYDDIDGMPRFYALIKKVFSPGFKLQITWFEADPDDEDECKWVEEKLPTACGRYKLGTTMITADQPMFSHLAFSEKISCSAFKVYPRKGETWALFKNWDIKWYNDAESHQNYNLEFVEILSDYVEGTGVIVAYLVKLKGFVSLFSQIGNGDICSFQIPHFELYRFSHRVPSFKMTGQEREGVPVGSYELDPASLPVNMDEIAASDDSKFMKRLDGDASTVKVNARRSNSAEEKKVRVDHIDDVRVPSVSVTDSFVVPGPSFYQFDAERSHEKFEVDQIWAFYGDEDKLPKYYGQIKGVRRTGPEIALQVVYLTDCGLPKEVDRWEDKDMIISCGRFKIKPRAKLCTHSNTNSVSHQVHATTVVIGKNMEYEIYPRKGEIWALYRGWTTKLKCSDSKNFEYDIVEVIEDDDIWMDVLFLEKVSGYSSIFKGKLRNTGSKVLMTIARTELLKFSHKLPAIKLTEKNDNNLRGFWELDPRAIPVHYLSKE